MADDLVAWFGYGSLVNRTTIGWDIVEARPARLSGWRRHWRARPDMPGFAAALLSVTPDPDAACDGLLVVDRVENLPALDRREGRYHRRLVDRAAMPAASSLPEACPVYVYEAMTHLPAHRDPPRILRSYLDVVMQGFLREHGRAGLERFIAETSRFDIPIHEDRHDPVYPRHVAVTARERVLFEELTVSIHRA
ncbi:gamma-glutamylcyclotransferase family protein [Zhengella sp. ZM62]|uniref:gamma-glutamylcyclotransferase family protein n=1 Tax=Zhengella sedimenti TaxID=3390035 RepID=UPI003977192E